MIREIAAHRELVSNLVRRELKSRYKGSVLGMAWSFFTPLALAAIYYFFFKYLVARGAPGESIIIGVFGWNFTAICMNNGMMSITGNSNLIKKVAFPRFLIPFSVCVSGLVDYAISLVIQFILVGVLLALAGKMLSGWCLLLPLLAFHHFILNLSFSLLLSACNVYYRDTMHLVNIFITAFFFMSPAMYDWNFIVESSGSHPWIANLALMNPLAPILIGYRSLILPGPEYAFPWMTSSIIGLLLPYIMLAFSYFMFQRMQRNFADLV